MKIQPVSDPTKKPNLIGKFLGAIRREAGIPVILEVKPDNTVEAKVSFPLSQLPDALAEIATSDETSTPEDRSSGKPVDLNLQVRNILSSSLERLATVTGVPTHVLGANVFSQEGLEEAIQKQDIEEITNRMNCSHIDPKRIDDHGYLSVIAKQAIQDYVANNPRGDTMDILEKRHANKSGQGVLFWDVIDVAKKKIRQAENKKLYELTDGWLEHFSKLEHTLSEFIKSIPEQAELEEFKHALKTKHNVVTKCQEVLVRIRAIFYSVRQFETNHEFNLEQIKLCEPTIKKIIDRSSQIGLTFREDPLKLLNDPRKLIEWFQNCYTGLYNHKSLATKPPDIANDPKQFVNVG